MTMMNLIVQVIIKPKHIQKHKVKQNNMMMMNLMKVKQIANLVKSYQHNIVKISVKINLILNQNLLVIIIKIWMMNLTMILMIDKITKITYIINFVNLLI